MPPRTGSDPAGGSFRTIGDAEGLEREGERGPTSGPSEAAQSAVTTLERGEMGPAGPPEWTPALGRRHWLEYLDARLDLTPFQEEQLLGLLDEGRHEFARWNPGLLNTRVSDATDPAFALEFSAPFQEFRRFVGRDQERILLLVAPRWNPETGRLEVRIVPER